MSNLYSRHFKNMLNNTMMVCFLFKSKKMTTFNTDPTYIPFNTLHLSNKKTHQSWFHSENSKPISLIFFTKADKQHLNLQEYIDTKS